MLASSRNMLRAALRRIFIRSPMKRKFTGIYENKGFGQSVSVSGPGSDLAQTSVIRGELPHLLKEFGIRSILDAPCGDYYWMRHVDIGSASYTGVDIVDALVRENSEAFADATHRFIVGDIVADGLPAVDLILCRDCLVHLPFQEGLALLQNFKRSGSRLVLLTTFPGLAENIDLQRIGGWRPIDLQATPYNLPSPLRMIVEDCREQEGRYSNKSLGLWRLDDIKPVSDFDD